MSTLLVKSARVLATMNDTGTGLGAGLGTGLDARLGIVQDTEPHDASVLIRGNVIEAVGAAHDLPQEADEVIDARGHVVIPGLINTHHHMFQTLTRALPSAQDAELFAWLKVLYPVWSRITLAMLETSTQVAMAELLLSSCTTSSDHIYLFPAGCTLDHTIEAAQAIGMRFHATRGGARVLGRDDTGMIAPGMAADLALLRLDDIAFSGALHDPVAALLFCAPRRADVTIVNGRVVVKDGQLTTVDLPVLIERHNRLERQLVGCN